MLVGLLAIAATFVLAIVGVAPDGGHLWYSSIQNAMKSAADNVQISHGGHLWF